MNVFCFDFDGVICDSAPETGLSAWTACTKIWPNRTAKWTDQLQEHFCRLRPVMHTGFEAIPLMRLILDGQVSDDRIFADFEALRDEVIRREDVSRDRLLAEFAAARDGMIARDESEWLRWNRFYPGLRELLAHTLPREPLFIITTKQERFATLLLRHNGLDIAAERIFGLEKKLGKPEVLELLMQRPDLSAGTFHFIEDRLETLKDVIALPALDRVRLYLVDWGYNTPAQRDEAARTDRIRVVSRQVLSEALARASGAPGEGCH
jgi:phosphoglycolate phosphatase-like HAD superfamily hydrolase